mgnify:CR=1 FL=1
MKLPTYFYFLRPLRSLFFAANATWVGWFLMIYLFDFGNDTARLFALAVSLPQLLGFLIAGAVHEPMHRPFALLLPDLRQRQRLVATVSIIVSSLIVTICVAWAVPGVSTMAAFGLAGVLVALPCMAGNNHQIRWPLAAYLIGLLLSPVIAPCLTLSMNTAPWSFLFGGVLLASFSLSRGFSRTSLRSRTSTFFVSDQSTIFTWGRSQREIARYLAERNEHKKRSKQRDLPSSREWTIRSVGPKSRDWLRVLDQQLGVSPVRKQVILFVSIVTMTGVQIAAFGVLGLFNQPQPFHFNDFFSALASLTAPAPIGHDAFYSLLIVIVTFPTLIPTLHGQVISRPRLAYPLARARLADLIFLHLNRDLLIGLLVPALAIWTTSLIGQMVNQHFHPGLGLPAVAAIMLAFSPFLPFVAMNSFPCERASGKFASRLGLFCFISLFLIVTGIGFTQGRTLILSPAGIFVSLLVTAAGLQRLRRRIRRHYATCDLPDGATLATTFSAPAAARQ